VRYAVEVEGIVGGASIEVFDAGEGQVFATTDQVTAVINV
jgi:hypothetical protein